MTGRTKIAVAAYVIIGIFSFGHFYANHPQKSFSILTERYEVSAPSTVFIAFYAATFWPFYWSVELQS